MVKMSEERKEYLKNYQKTMVRRIPLNVSHDFYLKLQIHALSRGESINGFIKRAIAETIERENSATFETDEKSDRFRAALRAMANSTQKTE